MVKDVVAVGEEGAPGDVAKGDVKDEVDAVATVEDAAEDENEVDEVAGDENNGEDAVDFVEIDDDEGFIET